MKRYLRTLSLAVMLLLAMMLPVQAASLDNITDAVGLLDENQLQTLEIRAREITEAYDFGVYVIVLDDYRLYADGDLYHATEQIFEEYDLGKDGNGLLLLLSMEDRDGTTACWPTVTTPSTPSATRVRTVWTTTSWTTSGRTPGTTAWQSI